MSTRIRLRPRIWNKKKQVFFLPSSRTGMLSWLIQEMKSKNKKNPFHFRRSKTFIHLCFYLFFSFAFIKGFLYRRPHQLFQKVVQCFNFPRNGFFRKYFFHPPSLIFLFFLIYLFSPSFVFRISGLFLI